MNILYLHDALHGGAAESLLQLLRGRESCNEILLAYGTDGPVTDKLSSVAWKQPPIRLYLRSWLSYRPRGWRACLRFPFALAAHALSLVRLWLLCNRERVDVIHTNCVHLIEGALLARCTAAFHNWGPSGNPGPAPATPLHQHMAAEPRNTPPASCAQRPVYMRNQTDPQDPGHRCFNQWFGDQGPDEPQDSWLC